MLNPELANHPVFQNVQASKPIIDNTTGTILFSNGLDDTPDIDQLPDDLRAILNTSNGVSGNNVYSQLNNLFKNVPGGPWYIDSIQGIIYVHNRDFEDNSKVPDYTYKDENGELIRASFSLQTKYTGGTSGSPVMRVNRINTNDPYNDKVSSAYNRLMEDLDKQLKDLSPNSKYELKIKDYAPRDATRVSLIYGSKAPNDPTEKYIGKKNNESRIKALKKEFKVRDDVSKGNVSNTVDVNALSPRAVNNIVEEYTKKHPYEAISFLRDYTKVYYEGGDLNTLRKKYPRLFDSKYNVTRLKGKPFNIGKTSKVVRTKPVKAGGDPLDPNSYLYPGEVLISSRPIVVTQRSPSTIVTSSGGMAPGVSPKTYKEKALRVEAYTTEGTTQGQVSVGDVMMRSADSSPDIQILKENYELKQLYSGLSNRLGALENALKKQVELEQTCELTVVGKPSLTNYKYINIYNVGKKWSGKWYIRDCTHSIDSNGYLTILNLVKR